jgi:hypothetical protein
MKTLVLSSRLRSLPRHAKAAVRRRGRVTYQEVISFFARACCSRSSQRFSQYQPPQAATAPQSKSVISAAKSGGTGNRHGITRTSLMLTARRARTRNAGLSASDTSAGSNISGTTVGSRPAPRPEATSANTPCATGAIGGWPSLRSSGRILAPGVGCSAAHRARAATDAGSITPRDPESGAGFSSSRERSPGCSRQPSLMFAPVVSSCRVRRTVGDQPWGRLSLERGVSSTVGATSGSVRGANDVSFRRQAGQESSRRTCCKPPGARGATLAYGLGGGPAVLAPGDGGTHPGRPYGGMMQSALGQT